MHLMFYCVVNAHALGVLCPTVCVSLLAHVYPDQICRVLSYTSCSQNEPQHIAAVWICFLSSSELCKSFLWAWVCIHSTGNVTLIVQGAVVWEIEMST